MSSADTKAVFLSYASQDAEAARRICDALRAAGVEVWFDQSELRGGDAWDAKIRKQIKECALFVPVISANTQARREGYFRLEWRLADQRTHLMSHDTPFIVPVVIDETRDHDARVPESFLAVQWTRLKAGDVAPVFSARVVSLLSPTEVPATGGIPVRSQGSSAYGRPSSRLPLWRMAMLGGGLVAAIGGVFYIASLRKASPSSTVSPADGLNPTRTPTDSPLERAYRLTQKVGLTREDLDAADALALHAAERDPGSARAIAVRAWVQAMYIHRKFDYGPQRQQDVQAAAKRALALNADDPDALNALAVVLLRGYSASAAAEAETLLQRALRAAPENRNTPILLGTALRLMDRLGQARTLLEEAAQRNPQDVQIRFALAESYAPMTDGSPSPTDVRKALQELDAAIAVQPFEGALVLKAILSVCWCGDLVSMRSALDQLEQLPLTERASDRAIYTLMWCGLMDGDLNRVLRAAAMTPRPFLQDSNVAQAKDVLIGQAYGRAGKQNLAQQHFRKAEMVVRERMQLKPTVGDETDHLRIAHAVSALGRQNEAAREIAMVEAAWREEMTLGRSRLLAVTYGAIGNAEKAAPYIERALNGSPVITDHTLLLDPRWDPLRGQPAFEAILERCLQRIASEKGATRQSVAPKSIAVLAFRQQSADPENEYLCEAISDELCNVLGRMPGLKVAASASAFSFKGKRVRPSEMAAQLGVAYLVDGRVQKIGSRVRVSAELIKASDESVVWKSDTMEPEAKDMFAVQDQVVAAIAKNLQLQLGGQPAAPLTIIPEAFRLYYEGRRMWTMRGEKEYVAQAAELFRRAIAADAKLGRAYSGLADTLLAEALTFAERDSERTREIRSLTESALRWEPESAEAHTTRGSLAWDTWRFREAEQDLRTAIRLNPSYAHAHQILGRVLAADGRLEEALAELKTASELDPLTSRIFDNYAGRLREAGRYTEALTQDERALALQPNNSQAWGSKMHALSRLGRHEEALAILRGPALKQSGVVGIAVLARAGEIAEAKKVYESTRIPNAGQSSILATLGRLEEALNALDAGEATATTITSLYFGEQFDPIRSDPRMVRYLTTLGVKDAHDRAQAWRAAHPPEKPTTKK